MDFHHISVLLNESLGALITDKSGIYVDCTLGGAGHSAAIAGKLSKEGWLIAIDQDPAAIEAGRERLQGADCKVSIVQNNFRNLGDVLDGLKVDKVDGILFDLGVSSYQLDTAARGFSYMQDAALDMRMDPLAELTAAEVVNQYSEQQLARIISEYGEDRWAKRIAQFIVKERMIKPVRTTYELVEIIKKAIPAAARRDGPHPAKRTFQAIRIEVNNELGILRETFETGINRLKTGGRICVITFHSLEDRIAKQTFSDAARKCVCPKEFPVCMCKTKPQVRLVGKAIEPGQTELEINPRARSARLRVAEKV